VLTAELDAAVADFAALCGDELSTLNGTLERKKLETLEPMTQEEWEKKKEESG